MANGRTGFAVDPRTLRAKRRLKKAGLTDEWLEGLIQRLTDLPVQNERMQRETSSEAKKRRTILSLQMRKLAEAIRLDPQAAWFKPIPKPPPDQPALQTSLPAPDGFPYLHAWLDDAAQILESDEGVETPDRRKGMNLRSFTIKATFRWIEYYLRLGRKCDPPLVRSNRSRNIETALLAAALLDDDTITAHTVTDARKKVRRSND